PAQQALTLAEDEMAAWMSGWTALWHPAVLWGAHGPPRVDVTYDHDNPQGHHVYALPEAPPSMLPEDWEQRVSAAGAVVVKVTAAREATWKTAVEQYARLAPVPADQVLSPRSPAPGEEDSAQPADDATEPRATTAPPPSPQEIHQKLLNLE